MELHVLIKCIDSLKLYIQHQLHYQKNFRTNQLFKKVLDFPLFTQAEPVSFKERNSQSK